MWVGSDLTRDHTVGPVMQALARGRDADIGPLQHDRSLDRAQALFVL